MTIELAESRLRVIMLLSHVSVAGLLSFGQEGMNLPLRDLNVLVGPNGSGKSNFIEVLALLRACPINISAPMREVGGVSEWFWKGPPQSYLASITATIENLKGKPSLRHDVLIGYNGGRLEVVDETIENEFPYPDHNEPYFYYKYQRGKPILTGATGKDQPGEYQGLASTESILSQISDPSRYPVLAYLQRGYRSIRLFRNWQFGTSSEIRQSLKADAPNDFIMDDGRNIDAVLSTFSGKAQKAFLEELKELFQGIEHFRTVVGQNSILLYLDELGGKSIPKTRLSDGTLRYLCLLSILIHPDPPDLVAIEEPELGLHPDLLPALGRIIKQASHRMQLVITTHSQTLLDSFSNDPEDVVVCSQTEGRSVFERLSSEKLSSWLREHTLGELWNIGQIGGTRW